MSALFGKREGWSDTFLAQQEMLTSDGLKANEQLVLSPSNNQLENIEGGKKILFSIAMNI